MFGLTQCMQALAMFIAVEQSSITGAPCGCRQVALRVGMTCEGCVGSVRRVLGKLDGASLRSPRPSECSTEVTTSAAPTLLAQQQAKGNAACVTVITPGCMHLAWADKA